MKLHLEIPQTPMDFNSIALLAHLKLPQKKTNTH